jgi:hypothetical protein
MVIFFETGSHYVAQTDFKLSILLPLSSSAGIIGVHHHTKLGNVFESYFPHEPKRIILVLSMKILFRIKVKNVKILTKSLDHSRFSMRRKKLEKRRREERSNGLEGLQVHHQASVTGCAFCLLWVLSERLMDC